MSDFPCSAAMLAQVAAAVGADPLVAPSIEALVVPTLNPVSAGFYRVHFANTSLVVKLIREAATLGHDRLDHMDYWRREAEVWQSGLLQPVGAWRPVHCYAVEPLADGRMAVWLEDLGPLQPWPSDGLLMVARHFGQWAGYYHKNPPEQPWLCRNFLPSWLGLATREGFFAPLHDESLLAQAKVASVVDQALVETFLLVEAHGLAWAKALEQLPQTLCHHDVSAGNVFLASFAGQPITTAIDFGYLGLGAVGEDLGTLISTLVVSSQATPTTIDGLFEAALAAYRAGFSEFAGVELDLLPLRQAVLTAIVVRQVSFVGFSLFNLGQDPPAAWQQQWFASLGGESRALAGMKQAYQWLAERVRELQQGRAG
jgi:hypothetical protein